MKKLMFFIITLSLAFSNMSPQAVIANSTNEEVANDFRYGVNQEDNTDPIRPGEAVDNTPQGHMSLAAVTASVEETQRQTRAFDCSTVTDVSEEECLALRDLYIATAGSSWIHNDNWLSSPLVSTWYGVDVGEASISLTKESNIEEFGVGDIITYTLVAENTGIFNLSDVSILDPLISTAMSCTPERPAILGPGDTLECSADYVPTQLDFDAGSITNVATVNAVDPAGGIVSAQADNVVTAEKVAGINLEKAAVPVSYDEVGTVITYEFAAENTGNVTLSDVEVTDPLVGLSTLECQLESESVTQPISLTPGQILECSAMYIIIQEDLDRGEVSNTATAAAFDPDEEAVNDTANLTITAGQTAALGLEKVATQIVAADESILTQYASVDDRIDYTYTLTNIGNVTLYPPYSVTDNLIASVTCPSEPASLAPLGTVECTASYTVDQADLDAGSVTNTATATAMDAEEGGLVITSDETSEEVLADQNPAIILTKTATLINGAEPDPFVFNDIGDEITYAFTIENTGNLTFTDLRIVDTIVEVQGTPIDLGPGEVDTTSFSATYTITQNDIDAGVVNNTAWVLWPDDPTANYIYSIVHESVSGTQSPALELTKTATLINDATPDPFVFDTVGDVITYSFSVENTGNVTLTNVSITDVLTGSTNLAIDPDTLESGEIGTVTATYTVTQADLDAGSITNTATAYGTFDSSEYSDDDGTTVSGTQTPALELSKTATLINGATPDPFEFSAVGDVITYSFSVENTGNVTLTDVNVTDALTGSTNLAVDPAILNPGDTGTVTATYTVTQADIDAGSITNTATAYGTFDSSEYSDEDQNTISGTQLPTLKLTKTASLINGSTPAPFVYNAVGDVITYAFSVENTGNVALTDVKVTDALTGSTNLAIDPAILDPGDTGTATATYTVTQADIDAGSITNTAMAYGTFDSSEYSDEDQTTISGDQTPTLELTKTATLINDSTPDPFEYAAVGDVITYSFSVENTGNVALTNVNVTDALTGSTNLAIDPATLDPGDTGTATATYTVTQNDIDAGSISNTATAYGTFDSTEYSDEDQTTVSGTQSATLELTKTATLINGGTPDPFEFSAVGDVITYSFSVENTGNVALTNVNVTDALTGSTNLAVDPATLGPGDTGTATATYTVTQADLDASSITNTATAYGTFDSTEYSDDGQTTVSGAQSATLELTKTATLINGGTPDPFEYAAVDDVITYSFSVENTGSVTLTNVNVSDALTGSTNLAINPATLGPGDTGTATATYTVTQAELDAGSIANTATAYGTFDSTEYSDDGQTTVSGTQTPALELNKTATLINDATPDPFEYTAVDDVITYTFSVENIGNVTLTDVNVTDALTGSTNLAIDPVTLGPGDTGTATATYTVTQDDIDAGSIANTATAYGTFDSTEYSDENQTTISGTQTPALELNKTATLINGGTPDPFEYTAVDDVITYTFSVENTGNVTLTDVNVTDALTGSTNLAVDPATLGPGDTGTATATYTVTQADIDAGSIANTATAYGTFDSTEYSDDDQTTISGSQTASLDVNRTTFEENQAVSMKVSASILPNQTPDSTLGSVVNAKAVAQPKTRQELEVDPPVVNYYVRKIDLNKNNLFGSLPEQLSILSLLEELSLKENSLGDDIKPSISSLAYLKRLVLSGNELTGPIPAEIGQLTSLEELELNDNDLSGVIPDIGSLIYLERLILSGNQLTGQIPTEIGQLTRLAALNLGNNQLGGTIPNEIGNLTNLDYLGLYENEALAGEIPEGIGYLTELTRLFIDETNLSGPIPMSFTQLTDLDYFWFQSTSVCEPLTQTFIDWKESVASWVSNDNFCAKDSDFTVFAPIIFR